MPVDPPLIPLSPHEAECVLQELAKVFGPSEPSSPSRERQLPTVDDRYQTLVEQLPAVVFMAFLDAGTGKAYVSPHIESTLGFSQAEWLEDPVRWYQQIHPEDKARWSGEAARLLLTGEPLRSVYRVIARDRRVVWFHCEAKIVHREDGRPWFIHGVAFDITDLKKAESALDEERNFVTAILDTVGALVAVLNPLGGIVRFNRACEETTGFTFEEVHNRQIWDVFLSDADRDRSRDVFAELLAGRTPASHENRWATRDGRHRLIAWSHTVLRDAMHHGNADEIMIDLAVGPRPATLTVSDNGVGFSADGHNGHSGMGLRIMRHRAAMIGGSLVVERTSGHTVVTCAFPAAPERDGDESARVRGRQQDRYG